MKKIGNHKFNLRHIQNGFVLLFTLFILLIIATLTITFFYLQFLEVNLIAKETENLQAFYLAEAGLAKGRKLLLDSNTNTKILDELEKKGELVYNNPVLNSCNQKRLASNSNKEGIFYYEYRLNPNVPDSDIMGIITITGTGWVDENESQIGDICKKKSENRREIENRFFFISGGLPGEKDLPQESFGKKEDRLPITKTLETLKYPVVTSWFKPNEYEKLVFKRKGRDEEITRDQNILLTSYEMTTEQRNAYINFKAISINRIGLAKDIDINDNEKLFPEEKRANYISTDQITRDKELPLLCGQDCPFELTESRSIQWDNKKQKNLVTIKSSKMVLKRNQKKILKPGLYFFEWLILEENSILNTEGDVLIYVKKLELERNAKLMGGPSEKPDDASPNDLVILAQRWNLAYQDSEDGIKIGSTATICGHIFAPSLKVTICKGFMGKGTRVYGSILTERLVTSRCDAGASFGPIWIIFEEYTNNQIEEIAGSWREVRNP
ncbi:MAG: hypothetical protein ACMUIU_12035 [bacterium]